MKNRTATMQGVLRYCSKCAKTTWQRRRDIESQWRCQRCETLFQTGKTDHGQSAHSR